MLTSCLGSKFLKENEKLLTTHEIEGVSGALKDETTALIEQNPNARLLGIFKGTVVNFMAVPFTHLAHIYKLGEKGTFFAKGYDSLRTETEKRTLKAKFEAKIAATDDVAKKQKLNRKMLKKLDKKEKKRKEGNQLMKWGEKLAVYDHQKTLSSAQSIKLYLNTKGYFNSIVKIDTLARNKKKKHIEATYQIEKGIRYSIDSIEYMIEDTVLQKLMFENLEEAPLQKGPYDQETLAKERDFIYNLAVNNGYFEFSKQYITFKIDSTTLGKGNLYVREVIRNPENSPHHKIHYIDSIVFVSDASVPHLNNRIKETYKNITFSFGKKRYSKKILQWRIPFERGDRYSRKLTIETQRQLSYLDNFKFVNVNYDHDTTDRRFAMYILTSPFMRYQTSSEFGFIQNTNGNKPSPFFNISLKNRNTFRTLEIVDINISTYLEGINDVTGEVNASYSSIQFSGDVSFNFPQFLFPLGRYYKKKMGLYNPKTRLTVGVGFEDRMNEYLRRSVRTSLAYSWQVRDQTKHTLIPLQLSLINSDNSSRFESFLQELRDQGITYADAFRSAYVNSSSYQLDAVKGKYNTGQDGRWFRLFIESGGHINNIFGKNAFANDIEKYQFFKGNIDLRKIEKITRKFNVAYRLNVGVSVPYGVNQSLPYEKYFFGGGSNSLRAWKPRRLGPGAFGAPLDMTNVSDQFNEINDAQEQPGELLVESSIEFRQEWTGLLEGTLFFDAGNIWLIRGNTVDPSLDPENDDGKFRWRRFMSEMALGTGIGFRLDFSFLILRLDLGLKLIDPAQPKGKRFVGDEIFRNFDANSAFNIGIGYAF